MVPAHNPAQRVGSDDVAMLQSQMQPQRSQHGVVQFVQILCPLEAGTAGDGLTSFPFYCQFGQESEGLLHRCRSSRQGRPSGWVGGGPEERRGRGEEGAVGEEGEGGGWGRAPGGGRSERGGRERREGALQRVG